MGNCCNFTEIFTLWILGWTLHFTDAKMPLFSFTAVNLWAPRSPPNPRGDYVCIYIYYMAPVPFWAFSISMICL